MAQTLKIGVVGPCGTGKSELVNRLKAHGYQARHIAQEHSFAPKMWQILSNPDILIYLKVSYPKTLQRKRFNWTENEFQEQIHRLRHAWKNADLIINTDHKTPEEIFDIVIETIHDLHLSSPDPDTPHSPVR